MPTAPALPIQPSVARPTISVVMPAFNAAKFLERSLAPLLLLRHQGQVDEVIVVDDGSTDDSATLALALGAKLLQTGSRAGPGAARNLAAERAHGEVLWFVDADVVVHPDAAARVAQHFAGNDIAAVFGSYCDAPPAGGFFSQYKNLIHHFHHQRNSGPSHSFWTACGAVRRQDFLALSGFDAAYFSQPSIEDVEFGFRLSQHGRRTVLDPWLRCTHLKQWTLSQVLATDILRRALPWSRLILAHRAPARELNVSLSERLSAAVAGALLVTLPLALLHPAVPMLVPGLLAGLALARNLPLARFFASRRGAAFAGAAVLFHQCYYVYSSAAYVWCWCERRLTFKRMPQAAVPEPAPLVRRTPPG